MKNHNITIYGKSNTSGGLQVPMNGDLKKFMELWPGERFLIEIRVLPKNASKAIVSYYYRKIVPEFQKAYIETHGEHHTLDSIDEMLLKSYPPNYVEIPKEETGGFELKRIRSIHELSDSEASNYIGYLKRLAGSEFDRYIDDSTIREIIKN